MLTRLPLPVDRFPAPHFAADSISDIIDPTPVSVTPYNRPHTLAPRPQGVVGLTCLDPTVWPMAGMDTPTEHAWSRYRLRPEVSAWWLEIVGSGEWDAASIELVRLHHAAQPAGWKPGDGAWPTLPTNRVRVIISGGIPSRTVADIPSPLPLKA